VRKKSSHMLVYIVTIEEVTVFSLKTQDCVVQSSVLIWIQTWKNFCLKSQTNHSHGAVVLSCIQKTQILLDWKLLQTTKKGLNQDLSIVLCVGCLSICCVTIPCVIPRRNMIFISYCRFVFLLNLNHNFSY